MNAEVISRILLPGTVTHASLALREVPLGQAPVRLAQGGDRNSTLPSAQVTFL